MKGALWVITIVGSAIGAFVSITGVLAANGAPQEAAAAAIGVACAVIPYCLARAVSELNDSPVSGAILATMAENLIAIRKNTSQSPTAVTQNVENKTHDERPNGPVLPTIKT